MKSHARSLLLGTLGAILFFPFSLGTLSAQENPQRLLRPQPWRPTTEDSLRIWAQEGLSILQSSESERLGDREIHAYGLLNRLAGHYLSRLGPKRMRGVGYLHTVFDSLGIKLEISQDPDLPAFTMIHFLHPVAEGLASLAYLYWFRGEELLFQPINLRGGGEPQFEVWWEGSTKHPYEAGIVYYEGKGILRTPVFVRLQLAPDASAWIPAQGKDRALKLGGIGQAGWIDIDQDGTPEIWSWSQFEPDSVFSLCSQPDCPRLWASRMFVRRPKIGYQMVELKLIDSPLTALILFVRALREGTDDQALNLVTDPELIAQANQMGWGKIQERGAFKVARRRREPGWGYQLRFAVQVRDLPALAIEASFENQNGKWLISGLKALEVTSNTKDARETQGSGGQKE